MMVFLKTLLVSANVNPETATAIHHSAKLFYGSGGDCQEDCNPEVVASCREEIKKEWGGYSRD